MECQEVRKPYEQVFVLGEADRWIQRGARPRRRRAHRRLGLQRKNRDEWVTLIHSALWEEAGVQGAMVEEYFLDNRLGKPDPRTFADNSYYSDVLLVISL